MEVPSYEWLVCIYTCEAHQDLLKEFYSSVIGKYLIGLPNAKVLEVYANPDIRCSFHHENVLTLHADEAYEKLSLKTHEMMSYCTQKFDFAKLLKIDVTTVMAEFSGAAYEGRKAIDQEKLLGFIEESQEACDYDGFLLHSKPSRQNLENWARKKGQSINYKQVFGSTRVPPFFSGKCYIVSCRFAKFIADNGKKMAKDHVEYLLGSEDLMVGRLFELF